MGTSTGALDCSFPPVISFFTYILCVDCWKSVCENVYLNMKKHKVLIPHWKVMDAFCGFILYPTSLASWAC